MYEHATLQEAYTGALIAGKGKTLNNINIIMARTTVKVENYVRVRFGAGVPWRRCWCVISPPDEKEYQKIQRDMKKKSPYDRSHAPALKGEIKFYDSRRDAEKKKKARPIATITDSYSAYALYPQSKALIDGSTLLKVEGTISIHTDPPSTSEGFVFIMPEASPMVSGFEMLLRSLFPTWDTFGLYGRPGRLVASHLDSRSLMFAMPKHKKYGYLEILDVTGLIVAEGSGRWTERDWRRKLKELTGQRMNAMEDGTQTQGRSSSRSSKRLSFGRQHPAPARPRVGFADDDKRSSSGGRGGGIRTSRSISLSNPGQRNESAPPGPNRDRARTVATGGDHRHSRNISDSELDNTVPEKLFDRQATAPPSRAADHVRTFATDLASTPERNSSEDEQPPPRDFEGIQRMQTPEPVNSPPAFSHGAGARPQGKPYHSPEMRRANSRLSSSTLSQLANAGGLAAESPGDDANGRPAPEDSGGDSGQTDPRGPAVQPQHYAKPVGMSDANLDGSREALNHGYNPSLSTAPSPALSPGVPPLHPGHALTQQRSRSPLVGSAQDLQAHGRPPTQSRPHPAPTWAPPSRSSPMGPPPTRSPLMGPPPGARGPSPMMNTRGPHPDRRSPSRDPRMGPPPPPSNGSANHFQAYNPHDPPHGPRGPPAADTQRPPQAQGPYGGPGSASRKPLPQRTTSLQRASEDGSVPPSPANSSGSFTQQTMDGMSQRPAPGQMPHRQDSQHSAASSRYDDTSSITSPDHASTHSVETQESVERPRAGVLKTVGEKVAAPSGPRPEPSLGYDVPDSNHGPRVNFSKNLVPRNKTPAPMNPGPMAVQKPSGGPYRAHQLGENDSAPRSAVWQPAGAAAGPAHAENGLSPEEFVLQRAAVASAPLYVHQRPNTPIRSMSPGPGNMPMRNTSPGPGMGNVDFGNGPRSMSPMSLDPGSVNAPTMNAPTGLPRQMPGFVVPTGMGLPQSRSPLGSPNKGGDGSLYPLQNMSPRTRSPNGMRPPPPAQGTQRGHPGSAAYPPPPQGQPPGTPGGSRPGTPSRAPFQGHHAL